MNLKSIGLYCIFLFAICFNLQLEGQGHIYLSRSFHSNLLSKAVNYSIYLPENYSEQNYYPVIYLLHGYDGDETSWPKRTNIVQYVDSLISQKRIPEIIIVLPDGNNSYYINNYNNQFPYEDMFTQELIPFIDSTYHCLSEEKYRAIAGLSMGGYGSVVLTLKHPNLFNTCINISGAVRTDNQMISMSSSRYEKYFGSIFGPKLNGKDRITEHYKNNSPYHLIDSSTYQLYLKNNWYFDCGKEDFLFSANKALHELFLTYHIPHEFHSYQGVHNWEYWEKEFEKAILFWADTITTYR